MPHSLSTPSFNLHKFYEDEWEEHFQVAHTTYKTLYPAFAEWIEVSVGALQQGKKLLFFGNGGSAADAQHLAAEFVVRFKKNRNALPAIALTTDTSILTAIGNDLGFEFLFSRQIEALCQEGDVAIGLSTSGQSPNILYAFEKAREKNLITVGLTGETGGDLIGKVDVLLQIPSQTTARIQEMHITLGQIFCNVIEYRLNLI